LPAPEAIGGKRQLVPDPRLVGDFHPLGEVLERQPPSQQMLSKCHDRLGTLGVGDELVRVSQRTHSPSS